MPIAQKRLKLWTSNLTRMFSIQQGQSGHDSLQIFRKGQGHVTLNFLFYLI